MIKLPKKPKKKYNNRPSLLLNGTIPRPLHGVNPRSIMGKAWWDVQRNKAYAHNNYYCHCCGVHKADAKLFQWLEGHEIYKVEIEKCRMTFKGVVALCHYCHMVVHAGRTTQLYLNETVAMTENKFNAIVWHGQKILTAAKLETPIAFRFMELISHNLWVEDAKDIIAKEYKTTTPLDLSTWPKWRLNFNGKLHPPKYETQEKWTAFYQGIDNDD